MEYAMLSCLIPTEYSNTFYKNSKHIMQDAANALQWNLCRGFNKNLGADITLFNVLPCGSFPQYYSRLFVKGFDFAPNGHNIPFCNIKLIRNRRKTVAVCKALDKWCQSTKGAKTLFVYTVSQPLLAAVAKIKAKHQGLHVCAIVADLPNMANLASGQSRLQKIFSKRQAQKSYSLLSAVDSFVLLTKYMADYMNITKPFCVVEGIAPKVTADATFNPQNDDNVKSVLYTGTLHKKFGVMHLAEAFSKTKDPNLRLVICGVGDSEAELRTAATKDSRINFKGQLPREEALKLQKQGAVLVNPRLNNEEFTKYSFPSKTMEYLASGVPVIAYKLDGIPDEYDEYIHYPRDDSAEALAEAIEKLCALSKNERATIGQNAKTFVCEQKNEYVQTKKILDFVVEASASSEI